MTTGREIRGGCHCGNIGYRLRWPAGKEPVPVRACDCSFCRKHGGAWTSNPEAGLSVTFRDPARVAAYRFGTGTADFHVCTECGVVPVITCELDGRTYAVVNVNTFEDVADLPLSRSPVSFGGEQKEERLARRARNWISNVELAHS